MEAGDKNEMLALTMEGYEGDCTEYGEFCIMR